MTVYLTYDAPLDWAFLISYLQRRRTAGVELIDEDRYTRTIEVAGDAGNMTVANEPQRGCLVLTVRGEVSKHMETIQQRVRRMFDLDSRQHEIRQTLGADPWIGTMWNAHPGIRVPGAWTAFELLVRTIVGQQVSVSAATTIMSRIVERTGRPAVERHNGVSALFPSADCIATADLAYIGMPARRVAALQNVASLVADKSIPFPDNDANTNPDDVKEALLGLPGIGPWTVEYFALRALRDPDAWPGTDLILHRMLERHPQAGKRSARSITDSWRPYRGYAAMHLWHAASRLQQ